MADPIVYGPAYSTYTRTVRLALEEKGVPYRLEEVNTLQGAAAAPEHLARHPFGKVPAFEHDGFKLYETATITRYVDDAFSGASLQPAEPRRRARMNQTIGVIDAYAYPAMIGQIVIQRLVAPLLGGVPDEAAIEGAMPQAQKCVETLDRLVADNDPARPTLADLHLIPICDYFAQTPEGKRLMDGAPNLTRWWQAIRGRPSAEKTKPTLA